MLPIDSFPRHHLLHLSLPHCLRRHHFPLLHRTATPCLFSHKPRSSPLLHLPSNSFPLLSCNPRPSPILLHLKPYLLSQWSPILKGWLCGSLSVYFLAVSVPKLSHLPAALSSAGPRPVAEVGLPLLALAFLKSAASYLHQAFLWEAALGVVCSLRTDVFERVVQRDMAFFEGSGSIAAGDVAYRITAEASQVADTVFSLLSVIVPDMLQLIAMASRMVSASPILSLSSIMFIPFLLLAIGYLGKTLRKVSKRAHISVGRLSAYLNEVLPSILIVKAYNGEMKECLQFRRLAEDDFRNLLTKRKMKSLIPQLVHVLYIGGTFVICAGSILASECSFESSNMVSFLTSLTLLVEPIKGVGKLYNELKQGEPALERLFDLVKFSCEASQKSDAIVLESVAGDIKFSEVSFRYAKDLPLVLDKLSLHIKPREMVALVGPSGGGKTTLAKLLLRLYEPLSGHIYVDDLDIKKVQMRSLRKHIGFVSQDMFLFTGNVAENIAYKDNSFNIDMVRVISAAKNANADYFIRNLPDGYRTNIGPKGSQLSGGQKQRVAIARVLYQESSILILDEATSALDSKSELLVRETLQHLMSNHTMLVIAHRIETVLMADRIVLLEGGKLEELTKSKFLARNGHGSLL